MEEFLIKYCDLPHEALTFATCTISGWSLLEWAGLTGLTIGALILAIWKGAWTLVKWCAIQAWSRITRKKGWPKITNVPGRSDRPMFGRKAQLAQLRAILVKGDAAAITGQGGVGKTRLAHAYIENHGKDYETVWYVNAESATLADETLALLGHKLGCTYPETTPPRDRAIDALTTLAKKETPALIVYDNVVTPKDVAPLCIGAGSIHYLITSRFPGNQNDWEGVARSLPLGTLDPNGAVMLLKEQSGRDGEDIEGLAKDLDYLALALVIAAKTLKKQAALTVADYLENYEHHLHDVPDDADYDHSTYGAVMVSYERITTEARALMHLMAFLGPDDLILPMVAAGAALYPEPLKQAAQTKAGLASLFSEQHDAGLIEPVAGSEGQIWTLHRLTQAAIRARLDRDEVRDLWAAAAANLVHALLPASATNPDNWGKIVDMLPHGEILLHHGPETGDGGKALDLCLDRIGSYLSARGDAAGSLPYQQKSLTLSEALYGKESEPFASALNQLATTHIDLGNLDQAEAMLQRALKIDRKLLPKDHPSLATDLNNLAAVHKRQKKFADAEEEYKEALRITEAAFGADSPSVAIRLDNLGVFYGEREDWNMAIDLHQRALDIRRAALGELHPSTANSYHNSAHMEVNRSDAQKAIDFARRAVAILHHLGIEGGLAVAPKAFLIQQLQNGGQDRQAEALRAGDFSSLDPLIAQLKQEHQAGAPQRKARIEGIIAGMAANAEAANVDAAGHIDAVRSGSANPDLGRQQLKDAIRERDAAGGEEDIP